MIDLHTHTNESDGTTPPADLVAAASELGLQALGITDHDTFAGYEKAAPYARAAGVELLCGIELSTKLNGKSVHLLGYFPDGGPARGFQEWVTEMQLSRRDRNIRLVERLRTLGLDIRLAEVEALGRSMTGRPHFARVLVQKGYVPNTQAAFDEYLDESAKGYVYRQEPQLVDAIRRVAQGGGVAVLAHPVRITGRPEHAGRLENLLPEFCAAGLGGLEVFHSDHGPEEEELYTAMAQRFGLAITGGSDFHGDHKPQVRLGCGTGRLNIPRAILDGLKHQMATNGRK